MSQRSSDHPSVVVFPPIILLATIALAFVLEWFMPLDLRAGIAPSWRIAVGVAALTAGVLICVVARTSLVRRGTNVNPLQPTTAIVSDGIYGWTRNPIYIGGTLTMIGIGLIFELGWLLPLLVPSILTLHFGVVRREERYLEGKFGDEYRRYKAHVPRYLMAV